MFTIADCVSRREFDMLTQGVNDKGKNFALAEILPFLLKKRIFEKSLKKVAEVLKKSLEKVS